MADKIFVSFTVPGAPVPQARAGRRIDRRTGIVRSFTVPKCESFQNLVRLAFQTEYPGFVPLKGPLRMIINFFMPIPESMPKRLRRLAEADETEVFHIKKPDGKNLRWGVEDALEHVAFDNDSQIAVYADRKTYSTTPRTVVLIQKIGGYQCEKA